MTDVLFLSVAIVANSVSIFHLNRRVALQLGAGSWTSRG